MVKTSYLNQMIDGLDKWLQSIRFIYGMQLHSENY